MGKVTLLNWKVEAGSTDPLTELLRTGARQLLQQATGGGSGIAAASDRLLEDGRGRRGAQWPPSRTGDPDRYRPGHGADPEGTGKTGKPITFRSALVPYVRKTQSLERRCLALPRAFPPVK